MEPSSCREKSSGLPLILHYGELYNYFRGFPGGSAVKNLPAMQEMQVQSLGWEDPLEEGMATHSSILAWRIPEDRGVWHAAVHSVAKSQT